MKDKDSNDIIIEEILDDISGIVAHTRKFLTYPAKSPKRKEILLEMAKQFKEAVAKFEESINKG